MQVEPHNVRNADNVQHLSFIASFYNQYNGFLSLSKQSGCITTFILNVIMNTDRFNSLRDPSPLRDDTLAISLWGNDGSLYPSGSDFGLNSSGKSNFQDDEAGLAESQSHSKSFLPQKVVGFEALQWDVMRGRCWKTVNLSPLCS